MNTTQDTQIKGKFASFCALLATFSSKTTLTVLIIAYVLTLLVLFPAIAADGQIVPLDLRFWYGPELVYSTFDALGEAGRARYMIGALTVDVAYPLIYSSMFAVWLTLLLPRDTRATCALRVMPFAVLIADLLENTSIAIMLVQYPEPMVLLARAASIFTASKWSLAALVIASTLALTLRAGWRALWARHNTD